VPKDKNRAFLGLLNDYFGKKTVPLQTFIIRF